jgi:hypothetical protein
VASAHRCSVTSRIRRARRAIRASNWARLTAPRPGSISNADTGAQPTHGKPKGADRPPAALPGFELERYTTSNDLVLAIEST